MQSQLTWGVGNRTQVCWGSIESTLADKVTALYQGTLEMVLRLITLTVTTEQRKTLHFAHVCSDVKCYEPRERCGIVGHGTKRTGTTSSRASRKIVRSALSRASTLRLLVDLAKTADRPRRPEPAFTAVDLRLLAAVRTRKQQRGEENITRSVMLNVHCCA